MKLINLKSQYPLLYKADVWIEVSDEIADFLLEDARKQHAYAEQIRYHKAYYSLNADDNIEHQAMQIPPSPDTILFSGEFLSEVLSCIGKMPPIQARRTYLHLIYGLTQKEIAQSEGVAKSSVSESIQRGLSHIREKLKHLLE